MKIKTAIRESWRLYRRNFLDLMGAYLISALIRAMCLTPMLFLLLKDGAWLAWLCVPLYLLIALPARQNYALAMQDMMAGGRVFSPRLLSFESYPAKLVRGLLGAAKMLLWLALPAAAVATLVMAYFGVGGLDGITVVKYATLASPTGSIVGGVINILIATMVLFLLPVIGCAVHCGGRHAAALEDRKLLKGQRLKVMALWTLGFAVFLPCCAAVAAILLTGGFDLSLMDLAQGLLAKKIDIPQLGARLYMVAAAIALLGLTLVPFKQLLPAVAARQVKEKNDAAA